jgi:hypothetical protein
MIAAADLLHEVTGLFREGETSWQQVEQQRAQYAEARAAVVIAALGLREEGEGEATP